MGELFAEELVSWQIWRGMWSDEGHRGAMSNRIKPLPMDRQPPRRAELLEQLAGVKT